MGGVFKYRAAVLVLICNCLLYVLGGFVGGVLALSSAVGPNLPIVYSLLASSGSTYFSIDTNNGVLTALKSLTRALNTLQFNVRATVVVREIFSK